MTKPEADPVAAVTLPEVPNVKHLWQRATLLWNGMFKFILNLVGALAFVLFAMLLYQIATERSIVIEPISVPQSLAANGYTPEVAARRLRDALTKYHEQSQTTMRGSGLTLHSERPNFVVPTVGLSSEAIATFIRDFFDHPRQQQISGEFTIAENQLWLRLRSNGLELYTSTDGVSPSNPDAQFALAAPKIFEVSEPYIVAATLYSVDRAKSIQRAEEIIAAGPESDQNVVWSYILIGLHLSNTKDHDRAIERLNQAIHLNPQVPVAFVNRGSAYLGKNDTDRAIADFSEAIRLDRKFVIAFISRARAYQMKDEPARASADLDEAIRIIPKNNQAFLARGLAHATRGDIEHALADFNEAIQRDPRSASAFAARGYAHLANRNPDHALADFDQAIRLDPQAAEAFVGRGMAHSANKNNDRAIADYSEAIRRDPKSVEAFLKRGIAYSANKNNDRAIADYSEAIRLDPENVEAFVNRGIAYSANKDNDRAIADYSEAIRLDPKNVDAFVNRGRAHSATNDHDRAIADCSEAIRLDPANPFAFAVRGEVHFTDKDNERAIADYQESFAIFERRAASDPSNTDWQLFLSMAYSSIGDVLVAQGKFDDAFNKYQDSLAMAERLASSDHSNIEWQNNLQNSTNRIGNLADQFVLAQNFAQALEASDLVIAVAPDQKWLHMNRAHALMFLNRVDEARTIYLRYRGEKDVQDGKPWESLVLEDFAELRTAGLTHPLMDEIEKPFAAGIN